jgi:hypothetical protein
LTSNEGIAREIRPVTVRTTGYAPPICSSIREIDGYNGIDIPAESAVGRDTRAPRAVDIARHAYIRQNGRIQELTIGTGSTAVSAVNSQII